MTETPSPYENCSPDELAALERDERELVRFRFIPPWWLRENPALGLTVIYLLASVIGILFHFILLRRFGFNVLEFSETSDFLMVVVREPVTIALALLGIPLYIIYMGTVGRLSQVAQRRFKRLQRAPEKRREALAKFRRYQPWLQGAFIAVYALAFLMIYSLWRAREIRAGDFKATTVHFKTDSPHTDGKLTLEKVALLGTTSRFLFFFDPASKRSEVVPLDSVARLVWDGRSRRERQADEAQAAAETVPVIEATPLPETIPAPTKP